MKDTNKARSKVFSFVNLRKHTKDDISDRMKKTLQERMIIQEKNAKFFGNRKDTVSVAAGNQFAGHTKSPFLMIHVTTGRAETAFTGKGNRFQLATMRTAINGLSVGGIMAVDHTFDVIQDIFTRPEDIADVFKVVRKNGLENVLFIHKDILQ